MTLIQHMMSIGVPFCVLVQETGIGGTKYYLVMKKKAWSKLKREQVGQASLFRGSTSIGGHAMLDMLEGDVYNFLEFKNKYFERYKVLEDEGDEDEIGSAYELRSLDDSPTIKYKDRAF